MAVDPIARIKEIATDLIGCCSGARVELEAELNELGVGTEAAPSEAFDEIAFECAECGWYCSMDEANESGGGYVCDECAEGCCAE